MGNLNKDPGSVEDGCGHRLFIWRRDAPCPPSQSGCTCETGSSNSVPSPRGVCSSILMTKRGTGARSRYHTLICLKRASFTIQSAGVHRNPVKAGGWVIDKRQKQPHFLSLKQGLPNFRMPLGFHQNQGYLHAFQWGHPCIKKKAVLLSPVVKPFFRAETMDFWCLPLDDK